MAQTTQPAKPSAPPSPANNGASAKNGAKPTNTTSTNGADRTRTSSPYGDAAPQPSLMQRLPAMGSSLLGALRGPRTNAPATSTNGKTGAPSAASSLKGSGKFIMGLIVFMLGAELLLFGLQLADAQFKLGLENTVFPVKAVPQMSWLSWFQLIYFAAILIFWLLLLRFNIIPRDPFGTKAQAQARANAARGGATSGANGAKNAPANQIPGIGAHKPRAARRREAATATATATTTAKAESRPTSGWRSMVPAGLLPTRTRSATSQPTAATPASTAKAIPTAKTTTAAKSAAPAQSAANSTHDAAYERVKAAQRQQRRRSAKR